MTLFQRIITIALCVLGTVATRFLPFIIFRSPKSTPRYVHYLGRALPSAIFSMLVVYCLKDVSILSGSHGLPEAIALAITIALHLCFRKMLVSIATGTVCYMVLVQFVF